MATLASLVLAAVEFETTAIMLFQFGISIFVSYEVGYNEGFRETTGWPRRLSIFSVAAFIIGVGASGYVLTVTFGYFASSFGLLSLSSIAWLFAYDLVDASFNLVVVFLAVMAYIIAFLVVSIAFDSGRANGLSESQRIYSGLVR